MDVLFFVLTAFAIIACVGDTYTTAIGIGYGMTEGNPIRQIPSKEIRSGFGSFPHDFRLHFFHRLLVRPVEEGRVDLFDRDSDS